VQVEQKYQPGAVSRPTQRFPHSGQMGYFSRIAILLYSLYTYHNDTDELLVTRILKNLHFQPNRVVFSKRGAPHEMSGHAILQLYAGVS
jgi:hypothetical protein